MGKMQTMPILNYMRVIDNLDDIDWMVALINTDGLGGMNNQANMCGFPSVGPRQRF